MPATEHRLEPWVKERNKQMQELQALRPEYEKNPTAIGIRRRIENRIIRIKALNGRIAKLGNRYNIVRVWGKYIIKDRGLTVGKEFQIYYTDIAEMDARMLTEMNFPDGLFEIHSEFIPIGRPIEMVYNKG